jgi:hypothetical protein
MLAYARVNPPTFATSSLPGFDSRMAASLVTTSPARFLPVESYVVAVAQTRAVVEQLIVVAAAPSSMGPGRLPDAFFTPHAAAGATASGAEPETVVSPFPRLTSSASMYADVGRAKPDVNLLRMFRFLDSFAAMNPRGLSRSMLYVRSGSVPCPCMPAASVSLLRRRRRLMPYWYAFSCCTLVYVAVTLSLLSSRCDGCRA